MIEFEKEEQIKEWLALLDIQVVLLKSKIDCEKLQCSIVKKSTDGFVHKADALKNIDGVINCASMLKQYLKN